MFAIILNDNKYIKWHSDKHRIPGSIIVETIPDEEDLERLHCYQYIDGEFIFDVDKWAAIEANRAESERLANISQEIAACKMHLDSSDYIVIKLFEAVASKLCKMLNISLPEGFEDTSAMRQTMRDRINELEASLKGE